MIATPALAADASSGAGTIAFYGDLGNDFGSKPPFVPDPATFLVRPSELLLAEDGSVALDHLRWSGWGTNIARATGEWSASDGIPDMADGKRTTSPAQLTLSNPGLVLGHMLYRCFQITFPHPPKPGMGDHECLRQDGEAYGYAPASPP